MKDFFKLFSKMFIPSACLWTIFIIVLVALRDVSPNDPDLPDVYKIVLSILSVIWFFGLIFCDNYFEYDDMTNGYHIEIERNVTIEDDKIRVGKPEEKIVDHWSYSNIFKNIIKFIVGKIFLNSIFGIIFFWIIVARGETHKFD